MPNEFENFICIDDFSPAAVKVLIMFTYAGALGELPEELQWAELLAIADKFGLEDMKSRVEKRLTMRLYEDTFFEQLDLAEKYSVEES